MENKIKIFQNNELGNIRVLEIDGQIWFVGKDVANILGYENTTRDVNRHVDDEDKGSTEMVTPGGKQKIIIINESGLYSLILSSKLPKAKQFKHWVTSEVLPSIRKHGAYLTDELLKNINNNVTATNELIHTLLSEKDKNNSLLDYIETLTPKADYYDIILQSKNAVPITFVAKDYGMSALAFNHLLHIMKIQYRMGNTWVLYQEYAKKGYMVSSTYYVTPYKSVIRTLWTQKGREFLYNLLKSADILPLCERG